MPNWSKCIAKNRGRKYQVGQSLGRFFHKMFPNEHFGQVNTFLFLKNPGVGKGNPLQYSCLEKLVRTGECVWVSKKKKKRKEKKISHYFFFLPCVCVYVPLSLFFLGFVLHMIFPTNHLCFVHFYFLNFSFCTLFWNFLQFHSYFLCLITVNLF